MTRDFTHLAALLFIGSSAHRTLNCLVRSGKWPLNFSILITIPVVTLLPIVFFSRFNLETSNHRSPSRPIAYRLFSRFNLETSNRRSPSRPYRLLSFSLETPNRRSGSSPTCQFFPVGLCLPGARGSFLWRYAVAISHSRLQ